jgi:hypothetical protein
MRLVQSKQLDPKKLEQLRKGIEESEPSERHHAND